MGEQGRTDILTRIAIAGIAIVAAILVIGTWLTSQSAEEATRSAVNSISSFYLDELTGRREQVVETNLNDDIENMQVAIELMTDDDLSDVEHLQAYQARMKQLYRLEKFAFVTSDGLIYTSLGIQDNIDEYSFDYRTLAEPEVSVRGLDTEDKKVIIAVPLSDVSLGDKEFVVCFTEQDMEVMTSGLSLQSDTNETTFCNIYTREGVSLTNQVLGGSASVSNLFEALKMADFEEGYALETVMADFSKGTSGIASFTFNGVNGISISSSVIASPSVEVAVRTTERPPWMSRPWLIFSCGGMNMMIEPMTSSVVMMSSQTFRRSLPLIAFLRSVVGAAIRFPSSFLRTA